LSLAPLDSGTIVAVRRTEDLATPFDLARVTLTTETHVSLAYLGTTNPSLRNAVCRLLDRRCRCGPGSHRETVPREDTFMSLKGSHSTKLVIKRDGPSRKRLLCPP
jgi:hypothetical protein